MRGRIPQLQGQALAQAAFQQKCNCTQRLSIRTQRAGGRARKLPVSPALVTSASTARNCPSFALMRGAGAAAASATGLRCAAGLSGAKRGGAQGGRRGRTGTTGGHRPLQSCDAAAVVRRCCRRATLLQSCVSRARPHGRARRRPQHSPVATARHAASTATKLRSRGIMCAASGTEAGLQGAAHDTLGGWPVPNQELLHWGHQPTKALPGRGTQPSTLGRPHGPTVGGPVHLRPKANGVRVLTATLVLILLYGADAGAVWQGEQAAIQTYICGNTSPKSGKSGGSRQHLQPSPWHNLQLC